MIEGFEAQVGIPDSNLKDLAIQDLLVRTPVAHSLRFALRFEPSWRTRIPSGSDPTARLWLVNFDQMGVRTYMKSGWWFGTFVIFPLINWVAHHPN